MMLAARGTKENIVIQKNSQTPFLEFTAHQRDCLLHLYDSLDGDQDDVAISALYKVFEALYFPPYSNEAVNNTFLEPLIRFWASKLLGKDGSFLSVFLITVLMAKLQFSLRLRGYHLVFDTQARSTVKGATITIGGFTVTMGHASWFE